MCLGIPGQIVEITDPDRLMAMADISGVKREVSVSCIAPANLSALVGECKKGHVTRFSEIRARRVARKNKAKVRPSLALAA